MRNKKDLKVFLWLENSNSRIFISGLTFTRLTVNQNEMSPFFNGGYIHLFTSPYLQFSPPSMEPLSFSYSCFPFKVPLS